MGAAESKARAKPLKHSSRLADRPSAPGKPQLVPSDKHSSEPDVVTIRWEPPLYDGGSPVTGYLVEHRRTGSPHWVRSSPTLTRLPELTLSGLEPGWRYQFRVSAQNAAGLSEPGELSDLLTVTLQRTVASAPFFVRDLKDTTALENEKAEMTVQVRGTPTPTVSWFKDGVELFSSRSYRVLTENETSTLIIHQAALADEGEIKCSATNRVGYAVTRCKLIIEAPPSIRLPRQYEEGLLFEKDEVIRLKVSVAGRPVPEVTWQLNGEPVAGGRGGRFELAHSERYATLRVGEARRSDRGEYQVRAVNKLGEDTASFLVTVADRPMAPGRAKVVMTLGRSVTLSWAAPEDDGGCKIGNYIVEYYRLGWNMWLKAATCRQLTTTLGDLIEGSEYKFRVKAENPYGVSDPSNESDVIFIPDPKRGLLEPPEHRAMDSEMSMDQWLEDKKRAISVSPTVDQQYGERKTKKKRGPAPPQQPPVTEGQADKYVLKEDSTNPQVSSENFHPEIPKRRGKADRLQADDTGKLRIRGKLEGNQDLSERKELNKKKTDLEKDLQEEMELNKILDERRKIEEFKRFELRKSEEMKRDEGLKTMEELKKKDKKNKEQVKKKPEQVIPESPQSPRIKVDRLHGSSELMLVLLPQSRGTTEERETSKRELFESSLALEGNVAPPISLSAPELGSGEPPELPTVRSAFSSTELLHERAMARFYQDIAQEEAESLKRRNSVQRRRSFGSRSRVTGSLQELRPLSETLGKPLKHIKEKGDKPAEMEYSGAKTSDAINMSRKTFSRDSMDSMLSVEDLHRKPPLVQQPSEEDREYEDSSFDEDEYDEEDEESIGDEDMEEGLDEEDEEEGFSGDEKRESHYTSESEEDSRYSYSMDEDTYQPNQRKMSYNEDTLISAYERRGPVILGKVSQESEPPSVQRNEHKTGQGNGSSNEVKLKPILKRNKTDTNAISDKNMNQVEQDITTTEEVKGKTMEVSEKRFEPNFTGVMPKPILKIREPSQESLPSNSQNKGAPIASVEPELNLLSSSRTNIDEGSDYETGVKKKQVRIEEPADMIAREGENVKGKSGSLGEDIDTAQVLISHYSDIVKEYGKMKKPSKPIYLNYESLKAAAEKEEENTPQIPEIHVDEPTPEVYHNEEEMKVQPSFNNAIEPSINMPSNKIIPVKESQEKFTPPSRILEEFNPSSTEKSQTPKRRKKRSPSPMLRPSSTSSTLSNVHKEIPLENTVVIPRTPSPELHLRPITPTEKKVHSYFDFLTDFSLFILACWLYLFKDERLSIPILFLMIYRQAHQAFQRKMEALRNKLPRRFLFWGRK